MHKPLVTALLAVLLSTCAGARDEGGLMLNYAGAPVTILRDGYGVPHVLATTREGLFFGDGYAIAEDRLGQMELSRRTARGEMAELVGPSAVASDRETRIDGYTEDERLTQLNSLPADLRGGSQRTPMA